MIESKKVSIIIPVFNGEAYLAEAIDSVLAQNYPNKEIIVINDGSTDQTSSICGRYSQKIRYLKQSNQGLGAARNQGVKLATGDYFAFLDCDDLWEPAKLTLQMQQIQDDSLVFVMIKQFFCQTLPAEEKEKLSIPQEIMPGYCASCLLISRKRFFEIGFFQEIKEVGEFIEWYSRVKMLQIPVVLINDVLAYRRIHRSNMGRQKEKFPRQDYLKILKQNLDRQREVLKGEKT
jgi:glycosyltransferase involved in cell wall biosynthesis